MNLKKLFNTAVLSFVVVIASALTIQIITELRAKDSSLSGAVATDTVTPTNGVTSTPKPGTTTSAPKPVATVKATPKPTAKPAPKPATCIVTINGARYNVINLKSIHLSKAGYDVFKCGTDMTAIYNSQHKGDTAIFSKLQKYRI